MSQKVYQTRGSNTKDRANFVMWTNEMDHFLAKKLSENYNSDTKIKPSTYAAVAALNVKFRLSLNEDHVKNRLKTLRKQYAILKDIISQKGFRWDDSQKMIVANDAAWREYIKVNHDAKPFRANVIGNYDALCSISRNDHEIPNLCDNDTVVYDYEVQSDEKQLKNLRWTDEMDSCLGKILVEQVQKGYKVGNILQPEAYESTVIAVNEKFGSEITKEHVKNRLRTWRKQYAVLTEILSHGGFKWDESEKMIVGEDSLWNKYIKAHPDARFFRGKVVENYDELLIIFSDSNFVAKNSKTTDRILERVEPIHASPIRCVKSEGKNMRWTAEMDQCLNMILVEQVKLGNKNESDNKFRKEAYDAAVLALNERFGLDITRDHVKNRIKTWKKLYGNVKEILGQKGFNWDKTKKVIVAEDSVWRDFVKLNPDARTLRGRVIWNYDDLCIIIGNDDPMECSRNDDRIDLDLASESTRVTGADPSPSHLKRESKKRKGDAMLEMMREMATNISRIADALTGFNSQSVRLDEVFGMVRKIPGFDDDLIIDACEFLSFDEKRAKMFLKMDERLRKLWLLKRLRSHNN